MSYLQRNKSHNLPKQAIVLLIIFVVGALVFSLLDTYIISLTSSVWWKESGFTGWIKSSTAYFQSKDKLAQENSALRERLSSYEAELYSLRTQVSQGRTLPELAGRTRSDNVLATVLVRPPATPYDVLVIDLGTSEGAKVGSKVFIPSGSILGEIFEAYPNISKVKLYSSSGEKTNAYLAKNSVPVTLVGIGGGNFKSELPRDTEVAVGDVIVDTSTSSRILSVVGEISVKPTDPFQEVVSAMPINIFQIRFVEVSL